MPRVLLRAGKRSRLQFEARREKYAATANNSDYGDHNVMSGEEGGEGCNGGLGAGGDGEDGIGSDSGGRDGDSDGGEYGEVGGGGGARGSGSTEIEGGGVSSGEGGLNHHDGPMAGLLWRQLPDTIAQSTTTTGINMLKQNVRDLQVRVNQLEKSINRACDVQDFCYIYLRPYGLSLNHVTKDSLSHILGCPVSLFTCIRRKPSISLKVKIPKSGLYTALSSNATGPHCVRLWYPRSTNSSTMFSSVNPVEHQSTTSLHQLNIVSWNCRRFLQQCTIPPPSLEHGPQYCCSAGLN